MHPKTLLRTLLPVLLIALPAPRLAQADEGMWTFDNFPAALVRERLGVEITPAWLERVRLSTVRLSNCTASFVSAEGLILTNHHCVRTCLEQLSSPGEDLLHGGFLWRNAALSCAAPRSAPTC
jgi:hypothetical protein